MHWRFPTYLKVPRSIGRFSLNIFGDLWGGKLIPVLVWMQDRYPSLYACRNRGNRGSDRNLLGIIGSLLEELWAFLWKYELIKCSIIAPFIYNNTKPQEGSDPDSHPKRTNICLICGRWRQRTCWRNLHCVTVTCQQGYRPTISFEHLVSKEY